MGITRAETGIIHGRFQILHNDHMAYLLAGKERCAHLVIGITNPSPQLTHEDSADLNRSTPMANPLTFYERLVLVRDAMVEHGIGLDEFTIVPLPINEPDQYKYYVPMDGLFFLTIYDDWGRRKLAHFTELGLNTHVLWERKQQDKGISGTDVRRMIVEDDPLWTTLVPKSVARNIQQMDIPHRLRAMNSAS